MFLIELQTPPLLVHIHGHPIGIIKFMSWGLIWGGTPKVMPQIWIFCQSCEIQLSSIAEPVVNDHHLKSGIIGLFGQVVHTPRGPRQRFDLTGKPALNTTCLTLTRSPVLSIPLSFSKRQMLQTGWTNWEVSHILHMYCVDRHLELKETWTLRKGCSPLRKASFS